MNRNLDKHNKDKNQKKYRKFKWPSCKPRYETLTNMFFEYSILKVSSVKYSFIKSHIVITIYRLSILVRQYTDNYTEQ